MFELIKSYQKTQYAPNSAPLLPTGTSILASEHGSIVLNNLNRISSYLEHLNDTHHHNADTEGDYKRQNGLVMVHHCRSIDILMRRLDLEIKKLDSTFDSRSVSASSENTDNSEQIQAAQDEIARLLDEARSGLFTNRSDLHTKWNSLRSISFKILGIAEKTASNAVYTSAAVDTARNLYSELTKLHSTYFKVVKIHIFYS
jgi:hypothetical protein